MKNMVIVFNHFVKNSPCGYLTYTHSHAKEFAKKGLDVRVFAPQSVLPILGLFKKNKTMKVDNVLVTINKRLSISGFLHKCKINFNGLFYYFSIKKRVKNLIDNHNVVLLDAHNFHAEGYAAYLIKKKYPHIKTTITFHGGDLESEIQFSNGRKRLIKVAKCIDYYVCVSDKLKKKLNNIGIYNVKTIYNGIEHFDINSRKKDNSIAVVADLIDIKKIDLVIEAFAVFLKDHPYYSLDIVGEGPLQEKLVNRVKELDICNHVVFHGPISNREVYQILAKTRIFTMISKPEGFGIVYPEAMYCGCVTIGTKNEGIDGFIKAGINGFLIEPSIDELLRIWNFINTNNCDIIIKQGISDAKKLSWAKNCDEYLDLR